MIEVALGAGLGASVRYLMTQALKSRTRVFPWATFIINITGALLLGFLHSKITSSHILLLLGTGFLGGYTTFSTFQVELVTLVNNRKRKMMLIYLLLTVTCGILAAYCGSWLGKL
ncbi:fluoride efflux transporter CrcB [Lactobacillus salivarius]|uniref:Fluoride-specific ion channel FluC n=1 Tax=Ligilactobacillus salivarius TaxID=1624 RepID=A0ABD6J4A9_9LACO|nr:fluoride efflux transporter CrcB [Ligilactobacillus salivarius]HBU67700.1 fluoride efflux transporter CrcB [Lactobacillus sp.]MBM6707957.1 fluoride efflux transporter CrcB [Ligilactobacillus salivarius]MDE1498625.1 fluoride efflux transporter CrcB [Ligilactobacillus salivarius]MDE1500458.1 fluoride efflux transporter CrcB [Ligilactobacillus salivarius]MDE1523766.1 fluoride efflux transporter CrcB [Ligilactobacillus salivarius]